VKGGAREWTRAAHHQESFVGKCLVLPYSLRAADGAPVSTPAMERLPE